VVLLVSLLPWNSRNRRRWQLSCVNSDVSAMEPSVPTPALPKLLNHLHFGGRYLLRANFVDIDLYFCKYRTMARLQNKKGLDRIPKYADMLSAMGTEPRLRIMQLLLSAHPDGLVVGDIQEELEIPNSTLSHHLDKLRHEDLVRVQRQSTFLRYTANSEALQELMSFLYSECCTRNKAIRPEEIVQISK